jgi:hypothetical protein
VAMDDYRDVHATLTTMEAMRRQTKMLLRRSKSTSASSGASHGGLSTPPRSSRGSRPL